MAAPTTSAPVHRIAIARPSTVVSGSRYSARGGPAIGIQKTSAAFWQRPGTARAGIVPADMAQAAAPAPTQSTAPAAFVRRPGAPPLPPRATTQRPRSNRGPPVASREDPPERGPGQRAALGASAAAGSPAAAEAGPPYPGRHSHRRQRRSGSASPPIGCNQLPARRPIRRRRNPSGRCSFSRRSHCKWSSGRTCPRRRCPAPCCVSPCWASHRW